MFTHLSVAALLASLFGPVPQLAPEEASPLVTVSGTTVAFGDDTGEYTLDGECDDPRFVGEGMARTVEDSNIMGDATDCAAHFHRGNIRLANGPETFSPDMCASINFGDNSSEWARDGECDDPRFAGPGTDAIMGIADLRADAIDCKRLCESGTVWLK